VKQSINDATKQAGSPPPSGKGGATKRRKK